MSKDTPEVGDVWIHKKGDYPIHITDYLGKSKAIIQRFNLRTFRLLEIIK